MKCFTYDNLMLNGRLGNQLWQIASTIGTARRFGGVARFNPNWSYREVFPNLLDEYFQPVPEGYEVIDGGTEYLQDFSLFGFMADEFRAMLQPSPKQEMFLKSNYPDFYSRSFRTSIHVRRGDYLKYPRHFPASSPEYYNECVRLTKEAHPNASFVVFSDDIEWCRKNTDYLGVTNEDVQFIVGRSTPVEVADRVELYPDYIDMQLMSKCNSHILSNSTFAWWGAFMSTGCNGPFDDKPMYPDKWFGPGVPNWENWEVCMPRGWRKIKC